MSKWPDLRISHLGGEGGLSEVQMFSDFTAEHSGIFRPKYLQTLMVLMVYLHLLQLLRVGLANIISLVHGYESSPFKGVNEGCYETLL